MRKWLESNKKNIVFIIYLIITFMLLFFHENWRDEAQAWLIAKNCNLLEIIGSLKYEGHFLLWFIILMPFAKLGLPYYTTSIISWIITSIAVWLLLSKAPFKFSKRVLLIFTFPLLYLFPIISRCYCLIPLSIILMCLFYKDRKERPLRFLFPVLFLANTHVVMLGMVGIVLLDYVIELYKDSKSISKDERKKRLYSFFIICILLIISMLPLVGCFDANTDIGNLNNIIASIHDTFFVYPLNIFKDNFFIKINSKLILIEISIITVILLMIEIKNYPYTYFQIYLSILWQCAIYSFIWQSSLQRASTIVFIILYYKWIDSFKEYKTIDNSEKLVRHVLLTVLLLVNIINGTIYTITNDVLRNYSNSYQVANYINSNLHDESVIISGPRMEFTSSIIPYITKNINFYQVNRNDYFTYAIWDTINASDIEYDDIKQLSNIFEKNKKLYYIYCTNKYSLDKKEIEYNEPNIVEECVKKGIFKEIFKSSLQSLEREDFILYEIDFSKF